MFLLLSGAAFAQGSTVVGHLVETSGDVKIDQKPAAVGAPIHQESQITTKDGRATLSLAGDSLIYVAPQTRFRVADYQKDKDQVRGRLELKFGKIRALVRSHDRRSRDVQIRTKGATMGVRGTDFVMAQEVGEDGGKSSLSISVLSGAGSVTTDAGLSDAAPKTVTVTDNQSVKLEGSADASGQGAPSPEIATVAGDTMLKQAESLGKPNDFLPSTPKDFTQLVEKGGPPGFQGGPGGPFMNLPMPPDLSHFFDILTSGAARASVVIILKKQD